MFHVEHLVSGSSRFRQNRYDTAAVVQRQREHMVRFHSKDSWNELFPFFGPEHQEMSSWTEDKSGGFSNFAKPKGAYDHHIDDRRWVLRGILREPS
jgi:hypothetical protein